MRQNMAIWRNAMKGLLQEFNWYKEKYLQEVD